MINYYPYKGVSISLPPSAELYLNILLPAFYSRFKTGMYVPMVVWWNLRLETVCGGLVMRTLLITTITNYTAVDIQVCIFSYARNTNANWTTLLDTRVRVLYTDVYMFRMFCKICTKHLTLFSVQWLQNGGKCGICGDPYNLESPRPHEAGGEYGRGIISRHYFAGQVSLLFVCTIHFC